MLSFLFQVCQSRFLIIARRYKFNITIVRFLQVAYNCNLHTVRTEMASRPSRGFSRAFLKLLQAVARDDLTVARRYTEEVRAHREWLAFVAVKYGSIKVLRWLRIQLIEDPLVHSDLRMLARRYRNPKICRHLAQLSLPMTNANE